MNKIDFEFKDGLINLIIYATYYDKTNLILRYNGSCNLEKDKVKSLNNIIDNLFGDLDSALSLEKMVYYIKTIFRDVDEQLLSIVTASDRVRMICYENNELVSYGDTFVVGCDSLSFKYDEEDGFNYSISNKELDILNYSDYSLFSEKVCDGFKTLKKFKNMTGKKGLSVDENVLCSLYQLFYGENPDFSRNGTETKAQVMMSILSEHGYSLGEEYSFVSKDGIPFCHKLALICDRLKPLGVVGGYDDVRLSSEVINCAVEIGNCVRAYVSCNRLNEFDTLCKLGNIYISRNALPRDSTCKEIAKHFDYDEKDVNLCLKLIKKIDSI